MWLVAATLCVLTDYLAPQVFPWYWGNLAGKNRPLSQVAEFGGVYGISFLHFAGSYALYALFKTILHSIAQGQTKASEAVMSALKSGAWSDNRGKWAVPTLFAIVLVWGYVRLYQMANVEKQSPHVRVAMIQPNTRLPRAGEGLIPRDEVRDILENRIPSLVGKAAAAGPLDMIVLPESAVPNNLTTQDNMVTRIEGIYSPEFASMMQKLATKYKATVYANEVAADVKLDRVTGRPRPIEFNSSIVYSPDGGRREYYHKRTLLAFGEYIPGAEFLDSSGLIALVPEAVRYSRFERGESAHNLTYYVKKEGACAAQQSSRSVPFPIDADDRHGRYVLNSIAAGRRFDDVASRLCGGRSRILFQHDCAKTPAIGFSGLRADGDAQIVFDHNRARRHVGNGLRLTLRLIHDHPLRLLGRAGSGTTEAVT
jgi:apolipoprotein N-acyltransferase